MNILITAPNLDTTKNVSGVAAVTNIIISHNQLHTYHHYLLGSPDKRLRSLQWIIELLKQIILFPFFLKKHKIDLVHQNLPFDPKGLAREFLINLWCRIIGIPVFLHLHGGVFLMEKPSNPLFLFFAKSVFSYSKKVVVLSNLEKDTLEQFYDVQGTDVLYNSVHVESLEVKDRSYDCKNPKLLFLGRIHESKGIEDIYEALKLLSKDSNFTFILCGAGPLEKSLSTDFATLLGNKFQFRSIVFGETKYRIIKDSDFFLLPSRYGEGLPMALLESMAAGVVPLVTDDASMKYLVEHGVNGLKVEKRNPKNIYSVLKEAIKDVASYHRLSDNAAHLISVEYDVKNYITKLNALYSDMMGK